MNHRLKQLRKTLGMSLEVFSNHLGVSKSAVSKIEIGTNNLSDQMLNSIIKTNWGNKYVREDWLRNGEGDMFIEVPDKMELLQYINEKPIDIFVKKILSQYAELTEAEQNVVNKFISNIMNKEE